MPAPSGRWAGSWMTENLPHRGFQQFVSAIADAGDSGFHFDVGNDANPLGGLLIGIEDADTADHGAQASGQGKFRNVAIGAGSGAAYDGRMRRSKGHAGVLGAALRDFVDQDHNLAGVVRLV